MYLPYSQLLFQQIFTSSRHRLFVPTNLPLRLRLRLRLRSRFPPLPFQQLHHLPLSVQTSAPSSSPYSRLSVSPSKHTNTKAEPDTQTTTNSTTRPHFPSRPPLLTWTSYTFGSHSRHDSRVRVPRIRRCLSSTPCAHTVAHPLPRSSDSSQVTPPGVDWLRVDQLPHLIASHQSRPSATIPSSPSTPIAALHTHYFTCIHKSTKTPSTQYRSNIPRPTPCIILHPLLYHLSLDTRPFHHYLLPRTGSASLPRPLRAGLDVRSTATSKPSLSLVSAFGIYEHLSVSDTCR